MWKEILKAGKYRTGEPAKIRYIRNLDSAPYMGERFSQHLEPAGKYMIERESWTPPDWEEGEVSFSNPLVIEFGNTNIWKRKLSELYDGLTGKELSQRIRNEGHDGIITVDEKGETKEIIDLRMFGKKNTA